MREIYTPRKYQAFTTNRIVSDPAVGGFLDMSLGKTVSSLTALDILLNDYMMDFKTLVIAPKNVAQNTWPDELDKWEHLKYLTYSVVIGTEKQRKEALTRKADIYIINRENVAWLVAYYQSAWPFKFLIVDESSSFKAQDSIRFKALKLVRPLIDRVVILTGTPAGNGLMDLWAQLFLLDQGKRLGRFYTNFRDRFFLHEEYKYYPKPGTEEQIYNLISDICISMKSNDYLELPPVNVQDIHVSFSEKELKEYKKFEKERVLEIIPAGSISEVDYYKLAPGQRKKIDPDLVLKRITAVNSAALAGKLLQYSGGAVYDNEENKQWHKINEVKLDALEELLEGIGDQPVIVAYWFKHELERLAKRFAKYNPRVIKGPDDVKDWNAGKIKLLFGHPQSMGHGLNLQYGGHYLIFYTLPWSLELYQQLIKRLDRPGQKFPVQVLRLIVKHTIDGRVAPALRIKAGVQDELLLALKAIIDENIN